MKYFGLILAFALFITAIAVASNEKHYSAVDVETFVLENGMRVAIKKTINEPNEVLVRLVAEGGVAELPVEERAAGMISAKAAVRSGISAIGFDKMHAMLYEHSIEFDVQMQLFSRSIELSIDSDELNPLFEFVNMFFTKARFSRKAYEAYKKALVQVIRSRGGDSLCQFNDVCMQFNLPQYYISSALQMEKVKSASFQDSERFFKRCFINPADFICVIVGDFDVAEVKNLVKKHLGSIPKAQHVSSPKIPSGLPDFTKGVYTKVVKRSSRMQGITRIAFPLQVEVAEANFQHLDVMSSLIQQRLMQKIQRDDDSILEISVFLEFPYYPSFHNPMLSIRYVSEPKDVASIGQAILTELKIMRMKGFEKREMETVQNGAASSDQLSHMDNQCWLAHISNYMIWGWDLNQLKKDYKSGSYWSVDEARKNISTTVSLDHYSIISLQP